MVTDELFEFIRTQIAVGMQADEIVRLLVVEGGWEQADVDEAFRALAIPHSSVVPAVLVTPEPATISTPVTEPTKIAPANAVDQTATAVEAPVQTESKVIPVETLAPLPVTPVETVVSAVAPATASLSVEKPSSMSDDFLGLFSGKDEGVRKEAESVPVQGITPHSAALAGITRDNTDAPKQSRAMEVLLAQVAGERSASKPEDSRVVAGIQGDQSRESTQANTRQSTVGAPVKFDLSQLRRATSATEAGKPASTPGAVQFEKRVETKSIAEAWLAGARDRANTPAVVAVARPSAQEQTTQGPAKQPDVTSAPAQGNFKIASKRTMASDILLRGGGADIPAIPAIIVPEEPAFVPERAVVTSKATLSTAEVLARKNGIKKVLGIAFGALVLVMLIAGAAFAFMRMRGPDIAALFSDAFTQFVAASSFGYQGSASADLVLSTATDGVERSGSVQFNSGFGGLLQNGASGYGNGVHRIKFSGGLQSGNFSWSTDVESDVRMIGSVLYFHVLSFPSQSDVDPDVFKTYWITLDLADIAKELAVQGVAVGGEGYGNFGGTNGQDSFNTIFQKSTPFGSGKRLADDVINGKAVQHFHLTSDPGRMMALTSALYHKYTNKDLTLDQDQQLRLKNALAKVEWDVWTTVDTNSLARIEFHADLDDDMVGVHVKGPVALSVTISDLNKTISVDAPTPVLTLEELRARDDVYKKVKVLRAGDALKVSTLHAVTAALDAYNGMTGRYPSTLAELISAGSLATSTVDAAALKDYFYAAYAKPDVLTKTGRCTAKGKACTFYHLGVNLDDVTNPALENDSDQSTDVHGLDNSGCAGEANVACYDVIAPVAASSTASSATTTPAQ